MYKSPEFMARFKSVGNNVQVFEHALILKPEMIELGDNVRIDDYSRLEGGQGLKIGNDVHICSFASIYGGGSALLEDYACITQGARLITGTEQPSGVMSSVAPRELRDVRIGRIVMGKNSFIGAHAVVMPDITIGEGAVVGAGAVVTKDVPPWTIVAGVPAKPIGTRQKLNLKQ
jgi:acetyltransferase-like isoleucine patch superfamily enzyme